MRDASVHERRAPDVRWHALGGRAAGEAGVAVAELDARRVDRASGSAIGLRTRGRRPDADARARARRSGLRGRAARVPGGAGHAAPVVAEVSWEGGRHASSRCAPPPATPSGWRSTPRGWTCATRQAARSPSGCCAPGLRRGGGPARARGADQEARRGRARRLRGSERRRGLSIAGRLGVALGLEHQRITAERRLVDAVAWIRGGPPQRRFDCIGV